tara:strand:+ start:271 stop:459 length:189 start_codon:yes stop_codon:yes gene_type:complete
MENPKVSQKNLDMVQHIVDSVYESYEYDDQGRVGINIPLPRKLRKQIDRANKKARKKRNKPK